MLVHPNSRAMYLSFDFHILYCPIKKPSIDGTFIIVEKLHVTVKPWIFKTFNHVLGSSEGLCLVSVAGCKCLNNCGNRMVLFTSSLSIACVRFILSLSPYVEMKIRAYVWWYILIRAIFSTSYLRFQGFSRCHYFQISLKILSLKKLEIRYLFWKK